MHLNKIGLLALSMSAIFMASSCNKTNPKVTEDEFNDAVSFKGVEYLQINQTMKMVTSMTVGKETHEFKMEDVAKQIMSPGISHTITTTTTKEDDKELPTEYLEVYATAKDDKTVTFIKREKEDEKFDESTLPMEEALRVVYYTPQVNPISDLIRGSELGFNDFEYKESAYATTFKTQIQGTDIDLTVKLFFANKKLVRLTATGGLEGEGNKLAVDVNAPLTYKEVVPPKPTK